MQHVEDKQWSMKILGRVQVSAKGRCNVFKARTWVEKAACQGEEDKSGKQYSKSEPQIK